MPYVLGQIEVEDYATWKSAFSSPEGIAMRKASGGKSSLSVTINTAKITSKPSNPMRAGN